MTDINKHTVSIAIGTTMFARYADMQICRTPFLMPLQNLLTMPCSHIETTKRDSYPLIPILNLK